MSEAKQYLANKLRTRGRPRSASEVQRANGYKNEHGRYQLTDGLKPWHERVVDVMISNPHAKVVDLAKVFHVSPQWMGQLLKSDAFSEYYKKRMSEHQNLVSTEIVSKMQSVAAKALDGMALKMRSPDISFGQLREAAELSLKGLGYTSNVAGASVHINNNGERAQVTVVQVPSDALKRAQDRAKKRMGENTKKIGFEEGNYQQVTSSLELGIEEVEDATVLPSNDSEI